MAKDGKLVVDGVVCGKPQGLLEEAVGEALG